MTSPRYRRVVLASLVIMVVPLAWSLVGTAWGGASEPSLAAVPPGSRCVEEPTNMRYQHMTLLRARRDSAIRDGRRRSGTPSSVGWLAECMDCHADRASFCDRCHTRAGVTLDCFGCHTE